MEAMPGLSCAEAVQRLVAYLDRAIAGEELDRLEAHLQACLDCCDRLAFSRTLDACVKARLPQGDLPPGLEARLREALRG